MKRSLRYWIPAAALAAAALAAAQGGFLRGATQQPAAAGAIDFRNARKQAAEFIDYYHSIPLSPDQKEVKNEALSAIPAPCCSEFSIATCCCPCNLAKSVWGLSNYLIARRGYGINQVKTTVKRWIRFTNKSGYSGKACHTGRCNRPFAEDGCGGMNERRIF